MLLYTRNCIVTGEPAKMWSGHVIMRNVLIEKNTYKNICIIAGFKDNETQNSDYPVLGEGCFGYWEPKHGIITDDEIANLVSNGIKNVSS